MNNEQFSASLQQDLLTLLCWSDQHGKSISKIVKPEFFEGDYRIIAERALSFWQQHSSAPKQHIADLLSDILEDDQDRRGRTYQRILVQMIEVKDQINTDYVLRSMNLFIRVQRGKAVILQAAEQYDARSINALDDVDSLLYNFLRERSINFEGGLRLDSFDRVLEYFKIAHSEFDTGIKELDEANIVPMRGKIWLLIASAKKGKTWLLIQLGKRAFLKRKKVLHISLEIEEEEVIQRYYQSLFGASKRDDLNTASVIKFDKKGAIDQIVSKTSEVPFTFASAAIREELSTRLAHFGTRASNFIIKRFPMSSLTLEQLEAYLESLEALDNFLPDLVLVDYPKIMKLNAKDLRISLGNLFENLRGLSQRRNFALGAVHQGNRTSADTELVKATHASEDWSIIGTCDFVVTYSQTAAEKQRGLARLFVDAARSEQDKFGVLISQSYKTGQFCLQSARLSASYARLMEQMGTHDEQDDSSDEE